MNHLPDNTLLQGGKYRIVRFIASGGFGCTYEAVDEVRGWRVAIKELFVKDVSDRDENTLTITAFSTNKSLLLAKVRRKFLEEVNALRAMSHPNIVKVYDSFEEYGTAYYVMDYIDGQSLLDMINRYRALPEQMTAKYINQIAMALDYVHRRNRLHLDIKPANIMIDRNDNAILIDFGVSKQYDEVNGENTSTLLGSSPGYSPIEQLDNNTQCFTPATDIYALGATLYKCVTGNTPPHAASVLSFGLPTLPPYLQQSTIRTICQSMSPRVIDRPQSIRQFLDCYNPPSKRNDSSALKWIAGGLAAVIAVIVVFAVIINNDPSTDDYGQMVSSGYDNGDYSWLCNRRVTYEELSTKSKHELEIMRNTIFARHGYIFKRTDLRNYFSKFSWYQPRYHEIPTSQLSQVELDNIELIKQYE